MYNKIIKKSKELNKLIDELYDINLTINPKKDFKDYLRKISYSFFDSDYLGIDVFINEGIRAREHSRKIKKPIYLVTCSRWSCYMLFVNDIANIRKMLKIEKNKFQNTTNITNTLKSINALDASILAYCAMAEQPLKNKSILDYLSKESLQLGKCLLGIKGKYNKEIYKTAKLYKDWAFYKQSKSSSRKDLDLNKLAVKI